MFYLIFKKVIFEKKHFFSTMQNTICIHQLFLNFPSFFISNTYFHLKRKNKYNLNKVKQFLMKISLNYLLSIFWDPNLSVIYLLESLSAYYLVSEKRFDFLSTFLNLVVSICCCCEPSFVIIPEKEVWFVLFSH